MRIVAPMVSLVIVALVAVTWPGCGPPAVSRDLGDGLVGNLLSGDAYIGSRACASCHPGEYAAYTNSGHSRTLRPAVNLPLAAALDGRLAADPEEDGVAWLFRRAGGRLEVERQAGDATESAPIDLALGSGHHAVTFLTLTRLDRDRPEAIEHRLTHYAEGDRLALTPGQEAGHRERVSLGRPLSTAETLKCLRCHATRLSARSDNELDLRTVIPNISCERCHGPARRHVEAQSRGLKGPRLGMAGADSAEEQMRFCGVCHRHPSRFPARLIEPGNAQLARFQPIGLMQSRCYSESGGELSCGSCHDPHSGTSSDAGRYERACLNCHEPKQTGQAACGAGHADRCVSCHMPGVDSGQGVLFSDHWIRVRRDLDAAPAAN
jgi:hypothetical protein